jgi:hypothetical protein
MFHIQRKEQPEGATSSVQSSLAIPVQPGGNKPMLKYCSQIAKKGGVS